MDNNAYKRAMDNLEFDKGFEERTLALLRLKSQKRHRSRRAAVYACFGIAVCAAITFILWKAPNDGERLAQYAAQTTSVPTVNATAVESTHPAEGSRMVAVSSRYGAGESSYIAPEAGEVLITEEVRRATEDEANEGAYFFVHIDILTPEQYANNFSGYIYNGRTIAEWRELADLAKGEYPYSEYNMDHGGNITGEQFEELERQAKALDAGENCEAAKTEYETNVTPVLDAARAEREASEAKRLKSIGYDVFPADTWTYRGKGEKKHCRILASVLSKEQITGFAADDTCGYMIEWVHNGDGVVDWDEYNAEAGN